MRSETVSTRRARCTARGTSVRKIAPVERPHQRRVAVEREIVHRDDGRGAVERRQHVLEVNECGPQPAQRARQPDGDAQLLQPRIEPEGLDAVRHEVGPARDRDEPQVAGVADRARAAG